jgi:hypothetical protein
MLKKIDIVWIVIMIAALVAAGSGVGAQKATPPRKPQDTCAVGEEQVRQLVLLMEADKNGKISKREFMQFMETEFDRLDVNYNAKLDPNGLKQSRIRASKPYVRTIFADSPGFQGQ